MRGLGTPAYAPGDIAPQSGIYRVVHYRHRIPHEITVRQGESFPSCIRCGQEVRFALERGAGDFDSDTDFRKPGKSVAE